MAFTSLRTLFLIDKALDAPPSQLSETNRYFSSTHLEGEGSVIFANLSNTYIYRRMCSKRSHNRFIINRLLNKTMQKDVQQPVFAGGQPTNY
jgi:hypothetical protein